MLLAAGGGGSGLGGGARGVALTTKFLGHDDGTVVLEKQFSPRSMYTSWDWLPRVDHAGGNTPVRPFHERSSWGKTLGEMIASSQAVSLQPMLTREDQAGGRGPLIALLFSVRVCSLANFPHSGGRVPLIALLFKLRYCMLDKLPQATGRGPVMAL